MEVYVVGEHKKQTRKGNVWELVGVFDTKKKAERECLTRYHFLGPVEMNDAEQGPGAVWLGCYYPNSDGPNKPWPRPEQKS